MGHAPSGTPNNPYEPHSTPSPAHGPLQVQIITNDQIAQNGPKVPRSPTDKKVFCDRYTLDMTHFAYQDTFPDGDASHSGIHSVMHTGSTCPGFTDLRVRLDESVNCEHVILAGSSFFALSEAKSGLLSSADGLLAAAACAARDVFKDFDFLAPEDAKKTHKIAPARTACRLASV